jgi:dTDP-4-amino-4,6-dideoxygalactose transaminase
MPGEPTHEIPAVAGGKPATSTPFAKAPRYGDAELAQLREAIEQQTLFCLQGKKVKQLETEFARFCGVRYAVACSSGTAAIHAGLIACGISPGDEVIVSPVTDMGSVVPILWQGAVPVFADLDSRSYLVTPETVLAKITAKTRAVLAVHLGGVACDLKALKDVCDARHITLIEDCAQAHGCRYGGKPIGTVGAAGCFSFNEYKHISCGDGGIVVTDDAALARRLRMAIDKGLDRAGGAGGRYVSMLGNNYRMTELQGAVAIAQLSKLPGIVERRRAWCAKLHEAMKDVPGVSRPKITDKCDPSWWFYMVRVDEKTLGATADEFAAAMKAEGVPLSTHYIGKAIYEYPLFAQHAAFDGHAEKHAYHARKYAAGDCSVAEEILRTCLMLHVNEAYTPDDLDATVEAFTRVATWYARKHSRR